MVGLWILVGLLLLAVRWLEGWLYRHLFKVGWLLTHNLQATTIFFYLFFLPGILLHEAAIWLVAGMFNVRADRSMAWPDAQTDARIRLDFVKLAKNAGKVSLAVIQLAPLVAGLIALWLIVFVVLRVDTAVAAYTGTIETLPALFQQITSAPDFWLWFYVAFTIANTMFPGEMKAFQNWKVFALGVGAFVILMFAFGLGEAIVGRLLQGPVRDGAALLAGLLGFVLAANAIVTVVLRVIEFVIETVTGSSADYQNGKLITMSRAEARQHRADARARAAKQQARAKKDAAPVIRSVYDLPFPLPPAPGKAEAVTVEKPPQPTLGGGATPSPAPLPASSAPLDED